MSGIPPAKALKTAAAGLRVEDAAADVRWELSGRELASGEGIDQLALVALRVLCPKYLNLYQLRPGEALLEQVYCVELVVLDGDDSLSQRESLHQYL